MSYLDPEYVDRIDRELHKNGYLALDDHESVWEGLKQVADYADELEFIIRVLTGTSPSQARKRAGEIACRRHPTLSMDEALKAEVGRMNVANRLREEMEIRSMLSEIQRND